MRAVRSAKVRIGYLLDVDPTAGLGAE